jgi:hypothetical protein
MRTLFAAAGLMLIAGCNSSSSDPNQAMDDTARMRNPPVHPVTPIGPITEMDIDDVPGSFAMNGKIRQAWTWKDSLGENILVLSVKGPYDAKGADGEDGQSSELYAKHFAKKMGDYALIASITDAEKVCPFDITTEFIPGSTTVTDLDKDGIAEIKLQYALACRSDVSPATMKLVMFEDGNKHSLTGNRWLRYSPDFKFNVTEKDVNLDSLPPLKDETETMLRTFGRYENEKEFARASPEFIRYARKEWLKYVMEKMGE